MTTRAWLRVAAACTAATTLGLVVGLAASMTASEMWDRLRTAHGSRATPATPATPRQGLAVAIESVDVDRAAAFEAAVFEAEHRARRRLLEQDESSRWCFLRGRTVTADGRVLYLLWFEPHGDLERTALSNLFSTSATGRTPRAWPDHELLTFVPVVPTVPVASTNR